MENNAKSVKTSKIKSPKTYPYKFAWRCKYVDLAYLPYVTCICELSMRVICKYVV